MRIWMRLGVGWLGPSVRSRWRRRSALLNVRRAVCGVRSYGDGEAWIEDQKPRRQKAEGWKKSQL